METTVVVALITSTAAIVGAGISIWGQFRLRARTSEIEANQQREQDRRDAAKVARKFHEPLARSAYDLQSRLYNMLSKDFAGTYLTRGNDRERTYAIYNTVFLLAQYFAWTEMIRSEIQFVDLGTDERTREFARLQDQIYSLFTTDRFPPPFRVFAGEQRALGEWMIHAAKESGPECIGYGTFLKQVDERVNPIVNYLLDDMRTLDIATAKPRLAAVQNALIDLLEFIDPAFVRFDAKSRTKIQG